MKLDRFDRLEALGEPFILAELTYKLGPTLGVGGGLGGGDIEGVCFPF